MDQNGSPTAPRPPNYEDTLNAEDAALDNNNVDAEKAADRSDDGDVTSAGESSADQQASPSRDSASVADTGLTANRNSRSRMPIRDAQGREILDDSYYDRKWWRQSSFSKLKSLDQKQRAEGKC